MHLQNTKIAKYKNRANPILEFGNAHGPDDVNNFIIELKTNNFMTRTITIAKLFQFMHWIKHIWQFEIMH